MTPSPLAGALRFARAPWLGHIRSQDVWLILLAMVAIASLVTPYFLTTFNLANLLDTSAIIGIIAIGQFVVILSGGFDLSVGGVLALAGMVTAVYTNKYGPIALVAPLLVGAACGLVNGIAVTRFDVPPFIATLGMLGIARGAAYAVGQQSVVAHSAFVGQLQNTSIGFVPLTAIAWLTIASIVWLILRRSTIGHYVAAIGGSEQTARLAGINVNAVKLAVYTLSGLLAGLAGLLYVVRSGSGVPQLGQGWELDSIAIVVIGGSNLFGGKGELPKAVAATVIYVMIRNVMNLASVDPFLQDIVAAAIVVAVVALRVTQSQER